MCALAVESSVLSKSMLTRQSLLGRIRFVLVRGSREAPGIAHSTRPRARRLLETHPQSSLGRIGIKITPNKDLAQIGSNRRSTVGVVLC